MRSFLTESVQNIFFAKNWVDHETARLDFQPLSNCKRRIGGGKILSEVKKNIFKILRHLPPLSAKLVIIDFTVEVAVAMYFQIHFVLQL